MNPPSVQKRTKALIGFLLAVLLVGGASEIHRRMLEEDLAKEAQALMEENGDEGVVVRSVLTVSKQNVVLGPTTGKIEVFVKPEGRSSRGSIQGIEYIYSRENGEWKFEESGGCTGEQCQIRGTRAFESSPADESSILTGL